MCGFIVSKTGQGNARFVRRRGMDGYGTLTRDGLTFQHFLLNVTGPPTPQPFVEDDIVCVYNGEIYNHPFERSDGENIIPLYLEHGVMMGRQLDGEFAIALYDFRVGCAHFITDRFATKPLWVNQVTGECASYESGVGGIKVPPATVFTVALRPPTMFSGAVYHHWDWTQYEPDYDRCIEAFERAVAKRYKPGCFIGLSSGYDSGAIACALRGKDFRAYTILASETRSIIDERAKLLPDVKIIDRFNVAAQEKHLRENAEDFRYAIRYDDRVERGSYKRDYAAKALSFICELAHGEGRKVYLSGTGADEILADYSLIPNQSQFKGVFPSELSEWDNFNGSCMYSYLGKEECVGGSWSIETRYPFLDTEFVQSFLALTADAKNRNYKAPLYEYLKRENFPFQRNRKIGWSV